MKTTRVPGPSGASAGSRKEPFDIEIALQRIRETVRQFPRAALFELAADGFDSVFEILVACILTIRTRDEVSILAARNLFARARTPRAIAALPPGEVDRIISACTFHGSKVHQILTIAGETVRKYGGRLPCDADVLRSFHGVGPKCANLTLGIACGHPVIGVDIHVHRVTNRWGYVATHTPELTMEALGKVLPRPYRVEINSLLVPFGKHVCMGSLPRCSECPVLTMCRQIGVTTHR